MQQKWIGYRIKGFTGVIRYANRMHTISETAEYRLRVLNFWVKHGLQPTIDAFKISRRTLFSWQKLYKDAKGNTAALNNKSRAPIHVRKPQQWPKSVIDQLLNFRKQFPFLGFEKIHIFLLDWCEPRSLPCPSVSTIRRIAKSSPALMPVKKRPPASTRSKAQGHRKPKGYSPKAPGECVGLDTIEIHGSGPYSGMRRYVVTFKDMFSRFALAAALPSKHAKHTAKLWDIAKTAYPYKPQRVLTDNGSEFKAEFTKVVLDDGAVRWLTYPKCPKMNAHAERFNRSIQEEFIEFHKDLLFEDIQAFNNKLLEYLIWFNESRPHYALDLQSPMQFLKNHHQCNMYWRDTNH
jgi:transposase InsO family protein